jgi:hypothetical protein
MELFLHFLYCYLAWPSQSDRPWFTIYKVLHPAYETFFTEFRYSSMRHAVASGSQSAILRNEHVRPTAYAQKILKAASAI